jgi:hypothetical protein
LDVNGITRFRNKTYVDAAVNQGVLIDNTSYSFIGGASNGLQNAANININGRSKAVNPGVLGLTACDNGYISFNTHDSGGSGTEWMRMTATGDVGIGVTNPGYKLDVNGSLHAQSLILDSNVITSANTVGQTLILHYGYMDLLTGTSTTYSLGLEPGNNLAINGSMFNGGFLNGSNASGENISWNRGRVIIRGCRQGTGSTPSTCSSDLRVFTSNIGWTTLTSFSLTDNGANKGYCTNVSPYFTLGSNINQAVLGIRITSPSNVIYRLGPTYLHLVS